MCNALQYAGYVYEKVRFSKRVEILLFAEETCVLILLRVEIEILERVGYISKMRKILNF